MYLGGAELSNCDPAHARSGCCSHHEGVCGCTRGRIKCCDGTTSPTCNCSGARNVGGGTGEAIPPLETEQSGELVTRYRILTGVIVRYECGDNCYLTIRADDSMEHTALCAAPECELWNEQAQMPKNFLGKPVQVTIEIGAQYDGEGNIVGHMDAFTKILFKR